MSSLDFNATRFTAARQDDGRQEVDLRAGGVGTTQIGTLPRARVRHSVDQSIPDATDTALTFDTERYDTDNIHESVTNPTRLTCQTPGEYDVYGHIRWAANVTGARYCYIRLNGTGNFGSDSRNAVTSGGLATFQSIRTTYTLAAGDYLELMVYQSSGAPLALTASPAASPEFGMTWRGA